jgi:CRP/FNR family transcriptional regulator, cyclic AMP receptor protein
MSTTINLFRNEPDGKPFQAGETIFSKGDVGDVMYAVQSGEVEITLDGSVIDTHGPGAIFGEMALIDDNPRSATATAKTDCVVVPISQQRFEFLVQQTPHFATNVMRVMVERMRRRLSALSAQL